MSTYSLSGTGIQTLSAGVTAVHITITTTPTNSRLGTANPPNLYDVCLLRFGDATGFFDAVPVVGGPQWLAVPSGATRCAYACKGGAVISLQEVIGGTPPFGGSGALSSLSDVALTSPADTQLLTYQASSAKWINANAPSGGGGGVALLLSYIKTTDTSGLSIPASTWTSFDSAQSFTVTHAGALVSIAVGGFVQTAGGSGVIGTRLLIDGATAYLIGGAFSGSGANANVLAGTSAIWIAGLSAASHTAQLQLNPAVSGFSAYCRVTTGSDRESFRMFVVQYG